MFESSTAGILRGESGDSSAFEKDTFALPSFLVALGFSFLWACFILFFASGLFATQGSDLFSELLLHFFGLLTLAVFQWISFFRLIERLSAWVTSKRLVATELVFACPLYCVTGLDISGTVVPFWIRALAWALLGISFSFLLLSWGSAWSATDRGRSDNRVSAVILSCTIAFAGLLCTLMVFAPWMVSLVFSGALYTASCILQLLVVSRYERPLVVVPNREREHGSDDGSDCGSVSRPGHRSDSERDSIKLSYRALFTPGVLSFTAATVLCTMIVTHQSSLPLIVVIVATALAGCIMLVVFLLLRRVPRLSTVERIVIPMVAACALLVCAFLVLSDGVPLILTGLLLTGIICYFIAHWNVLVVLSYRHHVLPLVHFAKGLIAPLGGFALGWGIQAVLNFYQLDSIATLFLPCLVVLFVITLGPALMPYRENQLVESIALDEEEEENPEKQETRKGAWRTACLAVAHEYRLSPRETEVFVYLAKGRNNEHISASLFISPHTTRTHTYRIYRKLAINSQQELISEVEKRLLRG
ncbi:MAG: helix-turn-helix transcriptional regulator [Coriobacteriales bacterium]|jgi:DNA-binding CsgD family transcriptional regulator|nr:helix-turn-helix transcriptional regulator [Coriobacteriales bacterium]